MNMNDVTSTFKDTLCSLATSRIREILSSITNDAIASDIAASDLPCTVATSAGSVVADTSVQLPSAAMNADGTPSAALDTVESGLRDEINADIESSPELAEFGSAEPAEVGSSPSRMFSASRCPHATYHSGDIRVREDVLCAIHDWGFPLGISPATSYSGVKTTVEIHVVIECK